MGSTGRFLTTIAAIASVSVACSGSAQRKPESAVYIDYYLPATGYQIEIRHQLRVCQGRIADPAEIPGPDAGPALQGEGSFKFLVHTSVALTPQALTDRSQAYRLDLMALPDGRHSQDLSLEKYPNGTVQTLNSTVEDRSAAAAGELLNFAASLAGIRQAVAPADFPSGLTDPYVDLCSPATRKVLAQIAELKASILELLRTRGDLAIDVGVKPKGAAAALAALDAQIKAKHDLIAALRAKYLTVKIQRTVLPHALRQSAYYSPSPKALRAAGWFSAQGGTRFAAYKKRLWAQHRWGEAPAQPILVTELRFGQAPPQPLPGHPAAPAADHFWYRQPLEVSYELCLDACAHGDGRPTQTPRLLRGDLAVPQWAEVRAVPFTVGWFGKRSLAMSFDPWGRITKLTWQTPARVEALAAGLAQPALQAAEAAQTLKEAQADAELAVLELRIQHYKKQVELKEAREAYEQAFSGPDAKTQ